MKQYIMTLVVGFLVGVFFDKIPTPIFWTMIIPATIIMSYGAVLAILEEAE